MAGPRSRTEPVRATVEAQSALTLWRGRVRLARATAQAWMGDLGAAEATLGSIHDLTGSPQSLDLLARIRAQQGRLGEAQSLWEAASDLEPENPSYRAAARRAKAWQRLRVRPDHVRLLSLAAAAALLLLVASALWRNSSGALPRAEAPSTGEAPASAPPTPVRPPTSPFTSTTAISPRASAASTAPAGIGVPGTVTTQEGDTTVVLFEDGLFASGAALTPAAERILDGLAATLKNNSRATVVAVTGHTDDVPMSRGAPFRDNVALGFARATAVAERLRRVADLDAGALQLRSLGADEPPFPNDSRQRRLRNRTVVIRIGSQPAAPLEAR